MAHTQQIDWIVVKVTFNASTTSFIPELMRACDLVLARGEG